MECKLSAAGGGAEEDLEAEAEAGAEEDLEAEADDAANGSWSLGAFHISRILGSTFPRSSAQDLSSGGDALPSAEEADALPSLLPRALLRWGIAGPAGALRFLDDMCDIFSSSSWTSTDPGAT